MKINIKALLTGTTLVVASTTGIMADPPKGLKLIPNEIITHPVFGEMKVISHKEDIKYYDEHKGHDLVEDFMEYVLNPNSYKKYKIDKDKVKKYAGERIARTRAGEAMLKVITANYMREYDRIKQFCKRHKEDLEAYREESLKHTKYVEICRLVENLKRFYDVEVSFERARLCNDDVKEKEMSVDDLLKLCERFQSGELETMEVGDLLKEVLDLNDDWKVVKERCDCQWSIERHYPEALEGFFEQHKDDFGEIRDVYLSIKEWGKSDDIQKLISLGEVLEQAYEAETKAENERRFSPIRRKNIPACDFLTLYEHFFEEKSEIKDINGILFHTLTLKKEQRDPVFLPLASGEFIILPETSSFIENYWIDSNGRFKAKEVREEAIDVDEIYEECGALHHELLHFMDIICWPALESITCDSDIFKKNDTLLKQLQKEFGEDSGYVVSSVLKEIYDNSCEMWAMYGILYVQNPENKDKGEFYYDPINEAVADAESKILVTIEEESDEYGDLDDERREVLCSLIKNEEHLVRVGHGEIRENQVSYVKKLNEMWGIYSFYFNKGEGLRELIGK